MGRVNRLISRIKKLFQPIIELLRKFQPLLERAKISFSSFVLGLTLKNIYKGAGAIIGIAVTVWGFYTHYYPEIEIEFTEPLRSNNVFTSVMNIKNTGNCSVNNIKIYFVLSDLLTENRNGSRFITSPGVYLIDKNPLPIQRIVSAKKTKSVDVDMGRVVAMQYGTLIDSVVTYRAKLKLYITYDYWYKKRTVHDSIFFRTSKLIDGKVMWIND